MRKRGACQPVPPALDPALRARPGLLAPVPARSAEAGLAAGRRVREPGRPRLPPWSLRHRALEAVGGRLRTKILQWGCPYVFGGFALHLLLAGRCRDGAEPAAALKQALRPVLGTGLLPGAPRPRASLAERPSPWRRPARPWPEAGHGGGFKQAAGSRPDRQGMPASAPHSPAGGAPGRHPHRPGALAGNALLEQGWRVSSARGPSVDKGRSCRQRMPGR